MILNLPFIGLGTTLLFLAAALIPAIALMFYVYKHDRIEKEPASLLKKCILGGCLAAIAAIGLEYGAEYLMDRYFETHAISEAGYAVVTAVMVGLAEEGAKFFFLKKFTWNSPEFNYRFDGIVYAVFVSLGFAALENVIYVFSYASLAVAMQRAVLTIPGHMSFAVYMGYFYGRAKISDVSGNAPAAAAIQWTGYLSAVFLHAVFDGSLMIGSDASTIFFYVFVAVLDLYVISTLRRESLTDRPVY